MYEKSTVIVPASVATTMSILRDVESIDRWVRPHLPTWPRVAATTKVIRRSENGDPELVRVTSSILGISDRSLTRYEWTDSGYRTSLVESNVLRSSSSRVDLEESAQGTVLTLEGSAEFKVRLPGMITRGLEKSQSGFRSALSRAIVEEARRMSGT